MESLTKQQLILLALLVSFVSSIATGIVTISLMDQAPPGVTQTINRVVERTVERVVPAASVAASNSTSASSAKDTVITKETVVVKDDDMVISAVDKNRKFIIRINKVTNEDGSIKERFGGLAVPISGKGLLVSDISILQKKYDRFGTVIPESYKAVSSNGSEHTVVPVGADEKNGLVFLSPQTDDGSDDPNAFDGVFVSLANSDNIKLGQSVIALGGSISDVVSTGIVSSLVPNENGVAGQAYSSITTNIVSDSPVSGTILINLSGDIEGILAGTIADGSSFVPANFISSGLANIGKSGSSKTPL